MSIAMEATLTDRTPRFVRHPDYGLARRMAVTKPPLEAAGTARP